MNRRGLLTKSAILLAAGPLMMPAPALALSESEASNHVKATIDEVVALVAEPGDPNSKAPRLQAIMDRRAAMPEIARFAAGTAWRGMSPEQQSRYTAAFAKFIATIYAGRFDQYTGTSASGQRYTLGAVVDAGKKGLLVKSSIFQTNGPPVNVEWLVTDRPGRVVVADIVIEGISMLVTEREQIAGMLEARGGNVDKLIADLGA